VEEALGSFCALVRRATRNEPVAGELRVRCGAGNSALREEVLGFSTTADDGALLLGVLLQG